LPLPFRFLAAWVGVWVSRYQQKQIEYMTALNQTLLERVGKKGFDSRTPSGGSSRCWAKR